MSPWLGNTQSGVWAGFNSSKRGKTNEKGGKKKEEQLTRSGVEKAGGENRVDVRKGEFEGNVRGGGDQLQR